MVKRLESQVVSQVSEMPQREGHVLRVGMMTMHTDVLDRSFRTLPSVKTATPKAMVMEYMLAVAVRAYKQGLEDGRTDALGGRE